MRSIKCYLRGAYGPGNLGDDILMVCTYSILRKVYSKEDICIGVEDVSMGKLLLPEANFIHIKKPFKADLVVLGGGGQFFSFTAETETKKSLFGRLFKSIAKQSSLIDSVFRFALKLTKAYDSLFFAKRIAAYCIGLGPFNSNGKNLERAKKYLPCLNYISVRDDVSASYYVKLSGGKDAKVFTDPSFNASSWVDVEETISLDGDGYLSFIVRDWPHDANGNDFLNAMLNAAAIASQRGDKVRFVSLYKDRDSEILAKCKEYECIFWSVGEYTPSEFVKGLCKSSKAIITARAHGVMLPAVFGVPSVAIEIEPKLREIHKMLPKGTLLVDKPVAADIVKAIDLLIENNSYMASEIEAEVSALCMTAKAAESDFVHWLRFE